MGIVTCYMQPLQNESVTDLFRKSGTKKKHTTVPLSMAVGDGFDVYGMIMQCCSRKYGIGHEITFADVCVFPQYMKSTRKLESGGLVSFEKDKNKRPLLKGIIQRLEAVGGFKQEIEHVSMKKP